MVKKAKIMAVLGILILCGSARATEGLIAHWKFDEGSGTTAYDSAGENDGTLIGDTSWGGGKIGAYAIDFDGSGDYVSTGSIDFSGTDKITVSFWVKPNTASTGNDVFIEMSGDYNVRTDSFAVFFRESEIIEAAVKGNAGYNAWWTTSTLTPGEWHHVVAVFDKSLSSQESKAYLNGSLDGAIRPGGNFDKNNIDNFGNRPLYFGARGGSSLYFNGSIDDVRIYNKALSAEEIQQLYQEGLSGSELAIANIKDAVADKEEVLAGIEAALEKEWTAYEALEEWLESGDYGDLKKGDIVKAKQKIHSATQHQEQSMDTLEKSIEKLEDALMSLGWEPEPEPQPIAHWKFDEGGGTTAYDSAGNNDGTIYEATWTTGQIDGALSFDGMNDYINLDNDNSLKPPLPVTFSAWINLSGLGSYQAIMALDEQSSKYHGIWFQVMPTNNLEVSYGDGGKPGPGSRRSKFGTKALNTNTWYHVAAVVRSPTDMDLYIDGVNDGGSYDGSGGSLTYSGGNSFIGDISGLSYYFNGSIDDVRIYDEALSAEEIQQLYEKGLSGP